MQPTEHSKRTFVKEHGAQLDADWNRLQHFYEASRLVSNIVASKPLEKRSQTREIVYARLDCSRPLLGQSKKNPGVFGRFGGALGDLHSVTGHTSRDRCDHFEVLARFDLAAAHIDSLIAAFPIGLCHGDCWHGNVFCTTNGRFILLDPLPAPLMSEFMAETASGCIDLAYFCASLFLRHPLAYMASLDSDRLNGLAQQTIEGYAMHTNTQIPMKPFKALCDRISDLWVEQYGSRLKFPIRNIKTGMARHLLRKAFFSDSRS